MTLGDVAVPYTYDASQQRLTVQATNLSDGKHSLRIWAQDERGIPLEDAPFFLPLWVEDASFEWTDGAMYFAIVDRFKDGDAGAASPVCAPVENVDTIANVQGVIYWG